MPFSEYISGLGEAHPGAGDVDRDRRAELVFGLGRFPGNGGWLYAIDDATNSYSPLGWFQVAPSRFIQTGGEPYSPLWKTPIIGNARNEKRKRNLVSGNLRLNHIVEQIYKGVIRTPQ